MSEMTGNANSMYDHVEAIRNLNNVEGFDPRNYMRVIGEGAENARYYLDVAYRKLWFRLKYPEGRISKRLLKLADDMAVIEARVYLSYKDTEENYIANAFSHKFRAEDAQFGNKFVELAETAATGRALADAGFGLQFADWEKDLDPEVSDAPFEANMIQGDGSAAYGSFGAADAEDEAGTVIDDDNLPGQYGIEEYIPMPGQQGGQPFGSTPAMQQNMGTQNPVNAMNPADTGNTTATGSQVYQGTAAQGNPQGSISHPAQGMSRTAGSNPAMRNVNSQTDTGAMPQGTANAQAGARTAAQCGFQASGNTTAMQNSRNVQANAGNAAGAGSRPGQTQQVQGNTPTPQQIAAQIDKSQPAEKIYAMLNRDIAAAVVVGIGAMKGKTLGQIAVEKPGSLEWYANQYNGRDNLLRAAAQYLITASLQQAS